MLGQGIYFMFSKVSLYILASAIYSGPGNMSNDNWAMLYSLCNKWGIDYKTLGLERAMAIAIALELNSDDYFANHGHARVSLETGMKLLEKNL